MKGALDVHGTLLAADVPHEVVRLPRPVLSADDLPEVLALESGTCAAVRCYVVDGRMVAVLVQAGCVPDPGVLLEVLQARTVRAATVAEVNAGTGFAALMVSPVALPDDVLLLADSALRAREVLYVPAGEGRVVLGIRSEALLRATRARCVALAARPTTLAERPGWDGVVPLAGAGADVIDLRGPRRDGLPRRPAG